MNKIDIKKVNPDVELEIDKVHRLAKTVVSVFGGTATEIFDALIASPYEKRKLNWMEHVTDAINYLIDKNNMSINELSRNEEFISFLICASQIAIRNHKDEKILSLKNAVINSVSNEAPEADIQLLFLNMVDTFTIWHLKILSFCKENSGICIDQKSTFRIESLDKKAGKLTEIKSGLIEEKSSSLEGKFKSLEKKSYFYLQILFDLTQRGLVYKDQKNDENKILKDWYYLTTFGRSFLSFIHEQ